jgi:hypothetical protein
MSEVPTVGTSDRPNKKLSSDHVRFSSDLSHHQTNQSTTSTPTLLPFSSTPCCSSLDPTTKDGALGLPADIGQPDDVLALTGSLPGESFEGLKTSRFFVT